MNRLGNRLHPHGLGVVTTRMEKMKRLLIIMLAWVVAGNGSMAWAAKVKVWHHSTPANYEKARLRGLVVSSEGSLHLARQLKPLVALDATHIWDIVEDKSGNLFVATGDD